MFVEPSMRCLRSFQLSLKSIITGADRNQLVLYPTYPIPMTNQIPPTILAKWFRFHQIYPQDTKPMRGSKVSRTNRVRYPACFWQFSRMLIGVANVVQQH